MEVVRALMVLAFATTTAGPVRVAQPHYLKALGCEDLQDGSWICETGEGLDGTLCGDGVEIFIRECGAEKALPRCVVCLASEASGEGSGEEGAEELLTSAAAEDPSTPPPASTTPASLPGLAEEELTEAELDVSGGKAKGTTTPAPPPASTTPASLLGLAEEELPEPELDVSGGKAKGGFHMTSPPTTASTASTPSPTPGPTGELDLSVEGRLEDVEAVPEAELDISRDKAKGSFHKPSFHTSHFKMPKWHLFGGKKVEFTPEGLSQYEKNLDLTQKGELTEGEFTVEGLEEYKRCLDLEVELPEIELDVSGVKVKNHFHTTSAKVPASTERPTTASTPAPSTTVTSKAAPSELVRGGEQWQGRDPLSQRPEAGLAKLAGLVRLETETEEEERLKVNITQTINISHTAATTSWPIILLLSLLGVACLAMCCGLLYCLITKCVKVCEGCCAGGGLGGVASAMWLGCRGFAGALGAGTGSVLGWMWEYVRAAVGWLWDSLPSLRSAASSATLTSADGEKVETAADVPGTADEAQEDKDGGAKATDFKANGAKANGVKTADEAQKDKDRGTKAPDFKAKKANVAKVNDAKPSKATGSKDQDPMIKKDRRSEAQLLTSSTPSYLLPTSSSRNRILKK